MLVCSNAIRIPIPPRVRVQEESSLEHRWYPCSTTTNKSKVKVPLKTSIAATKITSPPLSGQLICKPILVYTKVNPRVQGKVEGALEDLLNTRRSYKYVSLDNRGTRKVNHFYKTQKIKCTRTMVKILICRTTSKTPS
jgi:hypothetical protein